MITVQRTLRQPYPITAIVHNRGHVKVYTMTDSSLARIERAAVQKTTRRFTSLTGVNVIESTYFIR